MKTFFKKLRKKEEGAVLVLVALLMTVLLGITALAIDFGLAFYQKQKLQAACDAAALAAATALPDTTAAKNLAYTYMQENGFSGDPADVLVEFEGSPVSKVRVTQTYTMDTTFGRILGQKQIDVTCHAAAGGETTHVASGEFPYLIFAREGELKMGSQYYVAGSVHTNGALTTNPGDGTGSYMRQMSYGTSYSIYGHPCIEIDGEMYYVLTQLSSSDTRLYFNNQSSSTITTTWAVNTRAAESQTVETVQSWAASLVENEEGVPVKIYPVSAVLEQNDSIDEADAISGMTEDCEDRIASLEATANAYLNSVQAETGWTVTTDTNFVNQNHDLTTSNTILKTTNSWYSPSTSYNHQEAVFAIVNTGSGPAKFGGSGPWGSTGAGYSFRDVVFYSTSPTRNTNYGAFYYTSSMAIHANNIFSNDSMELYAATKGDIVIDGDIYCNGNLYLYNVIVNGDIYATGSVKTENSTCNGLFAADGDVYFGGTASSIDNISASTVNAMSIYSRNGNITTACADSGALYLAGVMYAPNGKITINANLYFYGNVIGKEVDASSKIIHAYPFSDLVGSDTIEDAVILPHGGDDVVNNIVLVE